MNISGNLKSAASWCLGLNNVESVIKVCKGTYFFNTNDHKQPTYTDKAVQLAEECGKIFLKYTVMGGAISQPLFDREIITPAKPNTLTGLLQEAIKLPYCAAKSALDMHSLYCEPLEYCGLYDDVKEIPNAPTGATVRRAISSQIPKAINSPNTPPASDKSYTYKDMLTGFDMSSFSLWDKFILMVGVHTTQRHLKDSYQRIRKNLFNSDQPASERYMRTAENVLVTAGIIFSNYKAITNVSELNPIQYVAGVGLLDNYAKAKNNQERIKALSLIAVGVLASYNNLI